MINYNYTKVSCNSNTLKLKEWSNNYKCAVFKTTWVRCNLSRGSEKAIDDKDKFNEVCLPLKTWDISDASGVIRIYGFNNNGTSTDVDVLDLNIGPVCDVTVYKCYLNKYLSQYVDI